MDSHKTVSTYHNLFEKIGEPKRYRTEVLPYQPNALPLWALGIFSLKNVLNVLCNCRTRRRISLHRDIKVEMNCKRANVPRSPSPAMGLPKADHRSYHGKATRSSGAAFSQDSGSIFGVPAVILLLRMKVSSFSDVTHHLSTG